VAVSKTVAAADILAALALANRILAKATDRIAQARE